MSGSASLQFSGLCSRPLKQLHPRAGRKLAAAVPGITSTSRCRKTSSQLVPPKSKETCPRRTLSRPPLTCHGPGLGHLPAHKPVTGEGNKISTFTWN